MCKPSKRRGNPLTHAACEIPTRSATRYVMRSGTWLALLSPDRWSHRDASSRARFNIPVTMRSALGTCRGGGWFANSPCRLTVPVRQNWRSWVGLVSWALPNFSKYPPVVSPIPENRHRSIHRGQARSVYCRRVDKAAPETVFGPSATRIFDTCQRSIGCKAVFSTSPAFNST